MWRGIIYVDERDQDVLAKSLTSIQGKLREELKISQHFNHYTS
jgi:hypothetical protein